MDMPTPAEERIPPRPAAHPAAVRIVNAIRLGTAHFNLGDAVRCYYCYRDCAAELVSSRELPPGRLADLSTAVERAEVTGATPRESAWIMRRALDAALSSLGPLMAEKALDRRHLVDLTDRSLDWAVLDDGVMDGSSSSRFVRTAGAASFEGFISIAGDGGFASVRCQLPTPLTLAGASGILLECLGDGRTGYKVVLKASANASLPELLYQASVDAPRSGFAPVRIPLSAFRAISRGRPVHNAPNLRAEGSVSQVGVMLSRDGKGLTPFQEGRFKLQLRRIAAYE